MKTNNINLNINYLMKNQNIGSLDLAQLTGIAPELVAKMKTGEVSNPSINATAAIAKYFAVTIENLVFGNLSLAQTKN